MATNLRDVNPDFRFVVWHDKKGVFLGMIRAGVESIHMPAPARQVWSKDSDAKQFRTAPVFSDRHKLAEYLAKFGEVAFPVDYRMQEVWDKDKDGFVTEDEIADASLPRWH